VESDPVVESDPGCLTQCDSPGHLRDSSNPHNAWGNPRDSQLLNSSKQASHSESALMKVGR